METTAPQKEQNRVTDPALAAALQSGDLRAWRAVFATPPPNAEWLATLRASPIYWFLSPMTWFWLLLVWAKLACCNKGWRLSVLGKLGLLGLILALPIGWFFYWNLWAGFISLLVGIAILWGAPSYSRHSEEAIDAVMGEELGVGIFSGSSAMVMGAMVMGASEALLEPKDLVGIAGLLWCAAYGAYFGEAMGLRMGYWICPKSAKLAMQMREEVAKPKYQESEGGHAGGADGREV